MICDFCSSPHPAWVFPAKSFAGPCNTESSGDWLACNECHRLIEAGDREGLAARVRLTPAFAVAGVEEDYAREFALRLQQGFFDNRAGEPRPLRRQ